MARKTLDRLGGDITEKFELFQEWLQGASKSLPSSKQLRSYLPYQKPERSIALPVALVVGGLALIGAITLFSMVPIRKLKNMVPSMPNRTENPEAAHANKTVVRPLAAE